MALNFNFKKFFKYFIIFLICYFLFHSFTSVKAYEINGKSMTVWPTENYTFQDDLFSGTAVDLSALYSSSYSSDNFDLYYDNIKSYIATAYDYNSFDEFSNDYYFFSVFFLQSESRYKAVDCSFYVKPKTDDTFNLIVSGYTLSSNPTVSNATYFRVDPDFSSSAYTSYYFNSIDTRNVSVVRNGLGRGIQLNFSSNGELQQFVNNSGSFVLRLYQARSLGYTFYYDSNFDVDVYFNYNHFLTSQNSNYYYTYIKYYGDDTLMPYNTELFTLPTTHNNYSDIFAPNIANLGDDTFGINFNTIENVFLDYTNDTSTSINCTNDRDLIGNVCYLYNTDIVDFDVDNTDVSNSAIWYFGHDSSFTFDADKYYIFNFRLYTSYDLDIYLSAYNLTNTNNSYTFNILNKYMVDHDFYKDYYIIVQPTHSGVGYLETIDFVFTPLLDFTNSLDSNFSFGVFKTMKIAEYSSQPTINDVKDQQSTNSLDDISNVNISGFFSNFRFNDHGLSSIILFPLNFVSSFSNYTCSPLSLPLPRSMGNIQLPCVSTFMSDNFNDIWNIYKLIFNGIIIYRILINLYSIIKNSYKPDNDRIEVVDL